MISDAGLVLGDAASDLPGAENSLVLQAFAPEESIDHRSERSS